MTVNINLISFFFKELDNYFYANFKYVTIWDNSCVLECKWSENHKQILAKPFVCDNNLEPLLCYNVME